MNLNASCRLAVVHLSGIVVTHYLQSITPALALGGELVYHRRPGEEGTVMSLVGRYTGEAQVKVIVSMSSGLIDLELLLGRIQLMMVKAVLS